MSTSPSSPEPEILWIEEIWFRNWDRETRNVFWDYYYRYHYKDGTTYETHTCSNDHLHLITKEPPDAEA